MIGEIKSVYLKDIKSKKSKHKRCFSGVKFGESFSKNRGIYTKNLSEKYKAV